MHLGYKIKLSIKNIKESFIIIRQLQKADNISLVFFRNDNKDKLKIPFNPNNIKLAIFEI